MRTLGKGKWITCKRNGIRGRPSDWLKRRKIWSGPGAMGGVHGRGRELGSGLITTC